MTLELFKIGIVWVIGEYKRLSLLIIAPWKIFTNSIVTTKLIGTKYVINSHHDPVVIQNELPGTSANS